MAKTYDAIVLGSGIAGLSVALALRKAKKKVLVVHKKRLPGESSYAAAGILDPILDLKKGSPLLPLRYEAFKRYPSLLKRLSSQSSQELGYLKTGMLYTAVTASEEKKLNKEFQWQRKMKLPIRLVSQKQARKLAPSVSPDIRSGLFYPTIGRLQASKFMKVIKQVAKKEKITFKQTSSEALLETNNHHAKGILLGKEKIHADFVVNAMGSWSGVSDQLGMRPPIVPVRGQVLVLEGKLQMDRVIYSSDGSYLVPWGKNRYLLGSTVEFVGFRPKVTKPGLQQIRKGIERVVPEVQKLKVVQSWAGLRPCSKDRLPLIGRTKINGLHMATGFFRSGILIGPYAGELLVKQMLSGKVSSLLKPFDPRRFS